ncbi:MAG: EAL domain-containing protein [Lachnospiraceae bacterium]|nr:EAL domain-containing protein [Lachnospiraceae bacterium]
MATEEEVKILSNLKVDSLLAIPLVLGGRPVMHAVFAENRKKRVWHSNSILFVADICKVLQTILEKKISNNSLVNSYTALREILDNIGSGIYVVDPKTREILFCNETMKRIVKEDMVGKHCWDFHLGERQYDCDNCPMINNPTYFREVYDNRLDTWFDIKNTEITWVNSNKVSLCTMTDITEKKKYEKRIEFQANNDFLTGLYNRMRCESDLAMCIEEAVVNGGRGALLFVDLDDFKHINDGLGHQYGDLLLKMISVGLQQIDGIEEHCYRVGGDEFIVIINPDEIGKCDKIVSAIMQLFDKPWCLNGAEYYCKMSMGIVHFPDEGNEVHELIKKADIAMYDAKKSGKNQYRYYNAKEEDKSVKRLDIEKNMRSAISVGCNEFEVYVQPIVDAATAKCVGGEALIRWNSGNLGFLGPTEFIPLAEHLGLITPIGSYFLKKACEANKRWSDMGIDVHLHVNLSVVQLMKNSIVEDVRDIIEETGVKPENMVLEITENLAINDMTRVRNIIRQLKEIGVSIALDDFGTGYSSLNYIKQLDLDIIKVDRTFITDIVSDDYAKVFVKLITELSEKLNVAVCIEGVEDKVQYKILKKMGVKTIQGFYFGKPMPIYKFEEEFLGIKE